MTLETAKLLKDNGWDKETEWGYCGVAPEYVSLNRKSLLNPLEFERMFYPSPSLEELLAVMPDVQLNKRGNEFDVYFFGKSPMEVRNEIDPDPTEAVATLWIKLKQEGVI